MTAPQIFWFGAAGGGSSNALSTSNQHSIHINDVAPSTQKCRSLLWSLRKVGGVWVGIPIARVPWHFVNGRPRDSIADGNPRKCGSHTTYKKRFDLLVKLYTAWLSWLFSQLWIALLHVSIEAESAGSKKKSRDLLGLTKCYMRYVYLPLNVS